MLLYRAVRGTEAYYSVDCERALTSWLSRRRHHEKNWLKLMLAFLEAAASKLFSSDVGIGVYISVRHTSIALLIAIRGGLVRFAVSSSYIITSTRKCFSTDCMLLIIRRPVARIRYWNCR